MKRNQLIKSVKDEKYFKVFLLGFISLFAVILPIMLYTGGYYIYYGDYNSQQIPFYIHAHDFIKSEGLGWDWGTDLGANFLGSYAFYLLGSPFFLMTLPLPDALVVFAMPVLLAVKHGVAALTAYAFIKRFVRNKNAAMIGGMLYAFSGFQLFNIFFNHFQDVTALFPLMLIALEEKINNERRGYFAVIVAVMGILNYFFFAGQAVFIIIYLLTRIGSPDFRITLRKFFGVAIEAVLGVMIAMAMLLPASMAILGNYRINERLYGIDLVAYSEPQRILRIIQSFFMIPDNPARPNLFESESAKWASIGGYLPLFSMAGVIAFAKNRKKHWTVKLTVICIICAFIPILNSMFYTFNSSYYARWFYMPILIMALMTAQAFDDLKVDFRPGIKICGIVFAGLTVISLLPKKFDEEIKWFKFAKYPLQFAITLGISVVSLVLLWMIDRLRRQGKNFMKTAVISTVVCSIVCTASVVYFGVTFGSYPDEYINNGIYGNDNITLEDEENQFYRIDISENYDNYPMFWGYSCIRAFQSTVPASIMEFYPEVGITRDVASRPPVDHYALRGLFSVKYYFNKIVEDNPPAIDMPGFVYKERQNGFYVYENKYYIPMGFTYDKYITEEEAKQHTVKKKERILMDAMVISEEDAEKYGDIMTMITTDDIMELSEDNYIDTCTEKREESCSEFKYDSEGFTAKIELETEKPVFFSVPYDKGWTAYVNGKPADIIKANYGFMAVKGEIGENTIEFRYETPGLKYGMIISFTGIILLAGYLIIFRNKKRKDANISHFYDYDKTFVCEAEKNYYKNINRRK